MKRSSPAAGKKDKDRLALEAFLLDIDCLKPLSKWTNRFNLFDVLKITRTEIRHSNVLAWLLDPSENHGLDDKVLSGFIRFAAFSFRDTNIFDDLLMDTSDAIIKREWNNIDILVEVQSNKYVLCIENKIDSGEHSNQLNRYRKYVESAYPSFRKHYIYLSPEGTEPSDADNWSSMSYQEVLQIVEGAISSTRPIEQAQYLIENYLELIRRDIVEDTELTELCNKIYAKHKDAIDLIINNLLSPVSMLRKISLDWAYERANAVSH